ncbi:MAG TPA: hypothetical protein VIH78_12615 [Terriglobales bacterium]
MLRISIAESRTQRRLIIEGNLIASWAGELRTACENARFDLHHRELVIDVRNLTAISQAGENLLLQLMKEGVTFRGHGIFTNHVLAQLASKVQYGREKTL